MLSIILDRCKNGVFIENQKPKHRFPIVDQLRGFAVLLMIIFHFSYDLAIFKFINLTFKRSDSFLWWIFPRVIVFLFLLSVGISLYLGHHKKIRWSPFWKRWLKVTLGAVFISLSTYYMFPKRWVYFGTLHCISLCSILALGLLRFKFFNLFLFLALFIPVIGFEKTIPWFVLPHRSMDYIPLFPWIGVVALGIFLAKVDFHQLKTPDNSLTRSLSFLGKHSLLIYLVHQPILFSLVWCVSKIFN
ncbi:MAG: heparan-alpha-glucosaminide N-acetyltransferase [Bacteriovoracaceae bacterium]